MQANSAHKRRHYGAHDSPGVVGAHARDIAYPLGSSRVVCAEHLLKGICLVIDLNLLRCLPVDGVSAAGPRVCCQSACNCRNRGVDRLLSHRRIYTEPLADLLHETRSNLLLNRVENR
jgi:hypothetical protein